jgi:hypothetical protein
MQLKSPGKMGGICKKIVEIFFGSPYHTIIATKDKVKRGKGYRFGMKNFMTYQFRLISGEA